MAPSRHCSLPNSAWRLKAGRDGHGAVTAARQAAGMAERSAQFAMGVRCWHDAVRLGDTRALGPLERVAVQADCAFSRKAIEDARAPRTTESAE
jgi:hypothetical protein